MSYKCDKCNMSVGGMKCNKCSEPLAHDTITKDGQQIAVSKCPKGCGMIKSPQCCGHDMACDVASGAGKESNTTYSCDKCGMGVKGMACTKCGGDLAHDSIDKDGQKIHVSKCSKGCGMVKSPQCCGQDMACAR
eukprot:TRINITY_DN16965_c0_g1_i2.p2 TRINITY_DN16965_c0_g1~~TRINITY_DN16965_c0_g1_i2.p2  ORF type:complete len:134 (-),score=18.12 TRINITY_DN16965_c0_g1_i2:76-477(-)